MEAAQTRGEEIADLEHEVVEAAVALGHALRDRGWTIACAESCTGGLVSRALTEIGGSSDWFERGFVTYSNAAKADLLGVSADTLKAHGAVSEEVAREMADGALARSRAQLALSITGIAGPGGAVPGKPVGTVCFGWSALDAEARTETVRFPGDRSAVRARAALHALRRARERLMEIGLDAGA
ncbi:CinA family protein [Burkholderiaceae bacterium FT117]|uniref:CinA family protein n=1 Tax=Zeimonas sediminis TaxID=2944268 RepID=UPI002342C63C|nr:CinA family protein [Zeimonas sediminis]MCM5572412.1 CinA family protein [Zeimonas sediminis]